MAKSKVNNELKTASVLAFERKLCCSDGQMFSGLWHERKALESLWEPLKKEEKALRGTISNRLKDALANDPFKLNAEVEKANLQTVDIVSLPFDKDTLKLTFTLRVLANFDLPSTCNDQNYQSALQQKIHAYVQEHQCKDLALRYAENLANARFLWRNRLVAEEIEVKVSVLENGSPAKSWCFDALEYSLKNFKGSSDCQINELAEVIRSGLVGESFIFLKIQAFARIGNGQEVFPSQELVRDLGNEKFKKSKYLYAVNDIAAMHSQKIGNAIRTIDTWYPGAEEFGPIEIETYGSVTSRGTAYRKPTEKIDFYSLFDDWILRDRVPAVEQQHYVVACLIRGGVFGEKEKD